MKNEPVGACQMFLFNGNLHIIGSDLNEYVFEGTVRKAGTIERIARGAYFAKSVRPGFPAHDDVVREIEQSIELNEAQKSFLIQGVIQGHQHFMSHEIVVHLELLK